MYVGPSAHFSFDGMTPTCLNQDKSQAAKDFRVLVITSSCLAAWHVFTLYKQIIDKGRCWRGGGGGGGGGEGLDTPAPDCKHLARDSMLFFLI